MNITQVLDPYSIVLTERNNRQRSVSFFHHFTRSGIIPNFKDFLNKKCRLSYNSIYPLRGCMRSQHGVTFVQSPDMVEAMNGNNEYKILVVLKPIESYSSSHHNTFIPYVSGINFSYSRTPAMLCVPINYYNNNRDQFKELEDFLEKRLVEDNLTKASPKFKTEFYNLLLNLDFSCNQIFFEHLGSGNLIPDTKAIELKFND